MSLCSPQTTDFCCVTVKCECWQDPLQAPSLVCDPLLMLVRLLLQTTDVGALSLSNTMKFYKQVGSSPSCSIGIGLLERPLSAANMCKQGGNFVTVKCAKQWHSHLAQPIALTLQSLRSTQVCRVGDQPLVRLALHPPLEGRLQLGATIAGTLDFRFSQEAAQQSGAAPKCVQVVVMLETEELVQDRWQAPSKRQTGPVRKVGSDATPCMRCSCRLFQRLIWSLMVCMRGAASVQGVFVTD